MLDCYWQFGLGPFVSKGLRGVASPVSKKAHTARSISFSRRTRRRVSLWVQTSGVQRGGASFLKFIVPPLQAFNFGITFLSLLPYTIFTNPRLFRELAVDERFEFPPFQACTFQASAVPILCLFRPFPFQVFAFLGFCLPGFHSFRPPLFQILLFRLPPFQALTFLGLRLSCISSNVAAVISSHFCQLCGYLPRA